MDELSFRCGQMSVRREAANMLPIIVGNMLPIIVGCDGDQNVSNCLWAFATLGYEPPRAARESFTAVLCERLPGFSSQALANTVWALAKAPSPPPAQLLQVGGPPPEAAPCPLSHRCRCLMHEGAMDVTCYRRSRSERWRWWTSSIRRGWPTCCGR